jgi:hypothetical protein
MALETECGKDSGRNPLRLSTIDTPVSLGNKFLFLGFGGLRSPFGSGSVRNISKRLGAILAAEQLKKPSQI